MPKTKKSSRSTKSVRRSTPSRSRSSFSWTHSHPYYGYVALGVVAVVLYFIWGLLG